MMVKQVKEVDVDDATPPPPVEVQHKGLPVFSVVCHWENLIQALRNGFLEDYCQMADAEMLRLLEAATTKLIRAAKNVEGKTISQEEARKMVLKQYAWQSAQHLKGAFTSAVENAMSALLEESTGKGVQVTLKHFRFPIWMDKSKVERAVSPVVSETKRRVGITTGPPEGSNELYSKPQFLKDFRSQVLGWPTGKPPSAGDFGKAMRLGKNKHLAADVLRKRLRACGEKGRWPTPFKRIREQNGNG
jgi:hypothetical protein